MEKSRQNLDLKKVRQKLDWKIAPRSGSEKYNGHTLASKPGLEKCTKNWIGKVRQDLDLKHNGHTLAIFRYLLRHVLSLPHILSPESVTEQAAMPACFVTHERSTDRAAILPF